MHVPISKNTVQVKPDDLVLMENGRVAWRSTDGQTGVSGLLPSNSTAAKEARRSFHGIVTAEVAELWRRPPGGKKMVRPIQSLQIDKRRYSRRPSRSSRIPTGSGYDSSVWRGLMVDNGANTDVVGESQLRAFENHTGFSVPYVQKAQQISNAGGTSPVVGIATARFPLHANGDFEEVSFKVLSGDAPMLIGLPLMTAMGWKLCKLSNTVATASGNILPLHQWNGHLFLYWDNESSSRRDFAATITSDLKSSGGELSSDRSPQKRQAVVNCLQAADEDAPPQPGSAPESNRRKTPLFTTKELSQIHSRSGHPHWRRMMDFLRRAQPDRCPENIRQQLQKIVDACKACAIYGASPRRVKVALPHEDGTFNEEIIVDVFSLNSRPVLSIIDRDTRFLSCVFLQRVNAASIWDGILRGWSLRYLGHPKVIRTDEGSSFIAADVQKWAGEAGVILHAVGVERASSMGLGEQVHHPLRRSFLKLRSENPAVSDELLLDVAVKAHNDSSGLNGLVPTLLVFGTFPRLPVRTGADNLPSNSARARMRQTAMAEFNRGIDELRLATTQKCQAPTAPDSLFPGDQVLVWYKKTKKWEGPFTLVSQVPHGFYVKSRKNRIAQLHGRECVRKYVTGVLVDNLLPPAADTMASGPSVMVDKPGLADSMPTLSDPAVLAPEEYPLSNWDIDDSHVRDEDFYVDEACRDTRFDAYCADTRDSILTAGDANHPADFCHDSSNVDNIPVVTNSEGKNDIERLQHAIPTPDDCIANEEYMAQNLASLVSQPWYRDAHEIQQLYDDIAATELLPPKDPRRTKSDFVAAIAKENGGLDSQQVFEKVRIPNDRRAGMNILRSRYVLAYKNFKTPEQYAKARLVVQAMKKLDRDYDSLFTYAPTVAKASARLLLTLAASLDMPIATRDVSQAYVCTVHPLLREVYVIPPKEAGAHVDELWRLRRPLYGLPEAGAMWYSTFARYHRNSLGMCHTATDPAVFMRHDATNKLDGMAVIQVDDTLIMGSPAFMADEERESSAFPSKGRTIISSSPVQFNGTHISRHGCDIVVEQNAYTSCLKSEYPRTAKEFATARGKASYATASTRPDQACAINQASQVRATLAENADHASLTAAIKALNSPRELVFPALDMDTLEIRVYADASWANNKDLSSQLGFMIYLVDASGRCSLIHWQSKKSRRVTRSTMAAEIFALCNGFDAGFAFKDMVEEILGREVPLVLFTDSKTAWDTVTSLNATSEKRLLIDLFGLRDAYRKCEMSNICCIQSAVNPADSMTKVNASSYLLEVMQSNYLCHPIDQQVKYGKVQRRATFQGSSLL